MLFEYRYFGSTEVSSGATRSGMSFAPDVMRQPTFLTGKLRRKLPFRETISALHAVVVSDLRFRPRDRTEYFAWRAQQDDADLVALGQLRRENAQQLEAVRRELDELRRARYGRWGPLYAAQKRFFDWLYKKNFDAWLVLDPVITVHPDEVAFECFSQDESSYGRLACSHEVFEQLGELAYGTTNVDYSYTLYDEFQKIRDDKETTFSVDPAGFDVQTGTDETYREVKIDLPESWVRGFLQVGTAMGLPGSVNLDLHPMDVHNLCFLLRRNKEKHGPRSLRFLLVPGKPVQVRVEPFGITVDCPRSSHDAGTASEIRIRGRRRLLVLERLIPVARKFRVVLMGTGMPSFWIADCGDLTFTLGLSGWTSNDWSSSANFDLLAPRGDVDRATADAVFTALRQRWLATSTDLSIATGFDRGTVESALVTFAQAGRTMYDLSRGVWRLRELSREPLDLGVLRFSNEREQEAAALAANGAVRVESATVSDGRTRLTGRVDRYRPSLVIDADRRLIEGECECQHHFQNKLRKGPCAHILALRLAHERGLGRKDPLVDTTMSVAFGAGAQRASGTGTGGASGTGAGRTSGTGTGRAGSAVQAPPVQVAPPRAPAGGSALGMPEEADRFVDFLLERHLVELDEGHRPTFVSEIARVLRTKSPAIVRANRMWPLLEYHPAVREFFLLEVEDLASVLEEWG